MSEKKLNKKLIIIVSVIAAVAIIATVAVIVLMPHRETVADVLDLGDRYMSELDYESAIREYKRAIEIDPKAEDAYLKLAEAYIALGDVDSAIEALDDGYTATQSERILARLNELRGGGAAAGAHSPDDAESIVMASTPQKTTYNVGDALDLTGLTLTVTYQDGAVEVVSGGYTCEVETLDEAGTQEVTVKYGDAETKFTVTVEDVAETEPVETEPVVTEPPVTEPPVSIEDLPLAEDLSWTLEDGVLTISGHGRMPDWYINSDIPWIDVADSIQKAVINDGITNIGAYTFTICTNLESVTIPNSVMSIGDNAFYSCFSLSSITIPNSVTNIEFAPFQNCLNLTSITVSEDNSNYCSVNGVLFSKDMTELIACPPNGVAEYYDIPDSVISIGDIAFGNCSNLTSITIPESVKSIGHGAFSDCTGLTSIKIPDSVTRIGAAFEYCTGLTSIFIPKNVTSIDNYAFKGCTNLISISVSEDNANYCSLDGVLFTKDMKELIAYPCLRIQNHYDIPDGVSNINDYSFEKCSNLATITIPGSVRSIGNYAFAWCDNLTSATISDGVVSIDDDAFFGCSDLASITIPGSVTSIGNYVFYNCPNLTIHAPAGSAAEAYARDNGIPFVAIG